MTTNTHELIEALEMVISRLDKAKYQRELDEYDCVTMTYDRDEIDKIRQALAIQPQAEAQPGVGELFKRIRSARERRRFRARCTVDNLMRPVIVQDADMIEYTGLGFVQFIVNPKPFRWWNNFIPPKEERLTVPYGRIKVTTKEGWKHSGGGVSPTYWDHPLLQKYKDHRPTMVTFELPKAVNEAVHPDLATNSNAGR